MPDPQHIHIMQEIQAFSLKRNGKHDRILRKRSGFALLLKIRHFHKLKHVNIMQEIQAFSLKNDSTNDKILRKRQGFSLFLKMRHFLKLKHINIMQEIQYFLEGSVRAGPSTYQYYARKTYFSLKHDGKHDKILRKRQGFSLFLKIIHFHKLKNVNIIQEIQAFSLKHDSTNDNILRKRIGFSLFLNTRPLIP